MIIRWPFESLPFASWNPLGDHIAAFEQLRVCVRGCERARNVHTHGHAHMSVYARVRVRVYMRVCVYVSLNTGGLVVHWASPEQHPSCARRSGSDQAIELAHGPHLAKCGPALQQGQRPVAGTTRPRIPLSVSMPAWPFVTAKKPRCGGANA